MRRYLVSTALLLLGSSVAARADAATRAATLVVYEGGIPSGAPTTVADVFFPVVDGADEVALAGELTGGEPYVFVHDQVVWIGSAALPTVLTNIDPAMGASDDGDFVVRVRIDGAIGLWTASGQLVVVGDAAPGLPAGAEYTDFLRPSMDRFGTVYWRGLVDNDGNGFSDAAAFFRAPGADPLLVERLWGSTDTVAGILLDAGTSSVDNDFAVSDDGTHIASVLLAEGSTTVDGFVALDDVVVAREGDPAPGSAANWQNFDRVAVNDLGDVVFTGDDSGLAASDEFIAHNGSIVLHEGEVVDGLTVSNAMRQIAINDFGQVAFTWQSSDVVANQRLAFFSCDGADLAAQARVVLAVEDQIDIDDDGVGDFTVTEIRGLDSEPGKILGDELAVYLEVDLDPGAFDAVIRVPVDCCDNGIHEGNEPCDDGNEDDTDACLSTCVDAVCGDGFVWMGVEECDDGNAIDDDACHDDCTLPEIDPTTGDAGTSSGTTEDGTSTGDPSTSTGGTDTSSGTTSSTVTTDESTQGTSGGSEEGTSGSSVGETTAETTDAETTTTSETTTSDTTTTSDATTTSDTTSSSSSGTSEAPSTSAATDTETDGDDGAEASEDGCGCRSGQQRDRAVALIALLFLVVRRRRSSR